MPSGEARHSASDTMKRTDITAIPEAELDRNPEHIMAYIDENWVVCENWIAETVYPDEASRMRGVDKKREDMIRGFLQKYFENSDACIFRNCPLHPIDKLCLYKGKLYVRT